MSVLTIKLFGGAISRDEGSIDDLSMEIDDNIVELINHLPRLSYPQNEFLLLQSCMDIVKKMCHKNLSINSQGGNNYLV